MLTPEGLFFAPGVRFKDLKVNDPHALTDALAGRAEHWFFGPARNIVASSPFASGIVVVCFIDAAAEFAGTKMVQWLCEAVPSCAEKDPRRDKKTVADSFEEDVRNGLVHHARLSRGTEFSLDLDQPMAVVGSGDPQNSRSEWTDFPEVSELRPGLRGILAVPLGSQVYPLRQARSTPPGRTPFSVVIPGVIEEPEEEAP